MTETRYDGFILCEIAAEGDEFQEAKYTQEPNGVWNLKSACDIIYFPFA